MVIGAVIAASNDLAFDLAGYCMILANDVFTAANGIYIQKKAEAKELGKLGIIFYNALFSLPFLVLFMLARDVDVFTKVREFEGWDDPRFLLSFACSTSFGLAITYTIVWSTAVNSALTTTIIGCLKNLVVAYVGMFVGGDYVFSWLNFTGITVSVSGAIFYSIVEFRRKQSASDQQLDEASTELVGVATYTDAAGHSDDSHSDSNFSDEEAAFLAED